MASTWIKGPPTADGIYWIIGFRSADKSNVFLNVYRVDGADAYAVGPTVSGSTAAQRKCGYRWRGDIEWHHIANDENEEPPEGAPGNPIRFGAR